jgi:hypothetical protein
MGARPALRHAVVSVRYSLYDGSLLQTCKEGPGMATHHVRKSIAPLIAAFEKATR